VERKRNAPKEPFIIESCESCGSFQVNPHPSEETAKKFFLRPDLYLPGPDPDGNIIDPLQRAEKKLREYQGYVSTILPFLPEGGTILDVGAGTGLMLSLFPDRYQRIAIEPNPIAAQKARERGLDVLEIWAENLDPPKTPLVLLVFNQSLDHFVRPDYVLGRTLNWLAPGGLVLLTGLINPKSLAARITGPNYRLYHPFHQVYPIREAVLDKLSSHGLETLGIWRPYLNTPYGSLMKLFKGAFVLSKALLLKNREGIPSPPWPGNTLSYLAQKRLATSPIKSLEAQNSLVTSHQEHGYFQYMIGEHPKGESSYNCL
jgi:SAM-dependent methyltransferase